MRRTPGLALRRTRQTLQGFRNGWSVLLASSPGPFGGATLRYDMPSGLVLHCPNVPGARVPVYEVFIEDTYRMNELLEGLPRSPTVVDIGAHIGCFSIAVAQVLPGAQVHAYEASPSTAAWLRRNVEQNAMAGRVSVHHRAVAATAGTISFADNQAGSSLNGLTAPAGTERVQVTSVTIRDAFAAAGGSVDLVKIDTEGAEYDMVAASAPADWETVHRIVLEYHDVPGHGWPELASFFAQVGLHQTRHEPVSSHQGTVWLSRDGAP